MSTPTKKDVEAAIYRHAAKYTGEEAVDIAKKIRGACCIKHMDPEHYRLVIARLDAERAPGLGVEQEHPLRLMTFVGADDNDMVMALPRGMEVNVALRTFYWKEVKSFTEMSERMTAIGHRLLDFYVLKDRSSDRAEQADRVGWSA